MVPLPKIIAILLAQPILSDCVVVNEMVKFWTQMNADKRRFFPLDQRLSA